MIKIKSESEESNLNKFTSTISGFGGTWLGLSDTESPGEMRWDDGDYLSYQNWAFGEPDITLEQYPGLLKKIILIKNFFIKYILQGGTCAAKSAISWTTSRCGVSNYYGYICEKEIGNNCPEGWQFYATPDGQKCYKFMLNGGTHKERGNFFYKFSD